MKFNVKIIMVSLLALVCVFTACSKSKEEGSKNLPVAKGKPGEMILIMDSAQWKGKLGDIVYDSVLAQTVDILPQPEPMFTISHVRPGGFESILRQARNVVMVTTLDSKSSDTKRMKQFFSEDALKEVSKKGKAFMQVNRDVYAKGQAMVMLFAPSEDLMLEFLENPENQRKIASVFNDLENKNLMRSIGGVYDKTMKNKLKKATGISLELMPGFQLAKETDDFIWLRHPELKVDKNIFIAKKPYTSQEQFSPDSIIDWRNQIAKEHLYGDPDNPESFVVTEKLVPVKTKTMELDGHHAVEAKGLWKTNNISMGGPFVSYVMVNDGGDMLYYIEGFVYAPQQKKREYMREMQVMLQSVD
ncbi:DUF4837 family protein [Limibacter armeniacum]|uniref:DUF4837 family protein n=1 Tax=Limibacter armeniacum TaxID=466084 RepID=UPI002FE69AB8